MNNPQPHDEIKKSSSDNLHILDILNEMRSVGLEREFISLLMRYSLEYEGLQDLMEMWFEEADEEEKNKIVADLQESLDDIIEASQKPEEKPYLHFDDLEEIKRDVIGFKKRLREEVDKQSGISELSRKTGIPQPSLSRFFSSTSMPRRTTLYKIAKALNFPESAIGFKWTR